MRYCADTWFILSSFDKDERSAQILNETKLGKAQIVIPIVVFAEATKKLLQRGVSLEIVELFWEGVETGERVELFIMDKNIAREAARVSLSFDLSLLDAFVAATSKMSNCDILLSADTDYKPLVKKGYLKTKSW